MMESEQSQQDNQFHTVSLREILQAMPKVDLHRHLEGSLRLQTLAEIAREHGIDLPSHNIEELRPLVQVVDGDPNDFHHFLGKFELLRRFYSCREAVERVAYEAVADAAADNVRYLELRFSPASLAMVQDFSLEEVTEWVIQATRRAQKEHHITVRLIVSVIRDFGREVAQNVIEVAIAYRDRGVVGLDLTGDEVRYPGKPFAEPFRRAKAAGLGITVHAGEAMGPERVHEAITVLEADRIGHGVRTIENSDVVQLVLRRGVALEVCPTSNLQTGVVRSVGTLPGRRRAAGRVAPRL
ncbi:MAG: adenosine deaminase, partial [Chloroflexota bacterium]|nr:adenosine deaminase [Chloroflexota bacterium]